MPTCVLKIPRRKFNDIVSFFIHFGFMFLKIKEGSQLASGNPVGLGESDIESVASMEPSPNRSGFCEENSKNVNYLLFM